MSEITATEAARHFSDVLDAIENRGEHFTIVRRGRVIAQLEPVSRGQGRAVKALLRRHRPDQGWTADVEATRELLQIDERR